MQHIQIAIDGPSGAGKSTISKAIAARLGIVYVDTGALYRTVGYYARSQGISLPAIAAVVDFLLDTQQRIARENSVIMDGRDIGTVILPDAQVKIFLTASNEARARRRVAELAEKGMPVDYETVLADMYKRDEEDRTRAVAPAVAAPDAIRFDNSGLTFEESVEAILNLIRETLAGKGLSL